MAKYKGEISQAVIDRKHKEKRGQGEGADYKPWVEIYDLTSRGDSHLMRGWMFDRDYHLLSDGERDWQLCWEWSLKVKDSREQFPIPQASTFAIAEEIGVEHPKHPTSKQPIVMTTDFLLTVEEDGNLVNKAISFKYKKDLNVRSLRTAEKLEIERLYWFSRKIDWRIITEEQLPKQRVKNISILRDARSINGSNLTNDDVDDIASWLTPRVKQKDTALRRLTSQCDKSLGFGEGGGISLFVVYHLIANRRWIIDMDVPIQPGNILVVENI